MSICQINFVCLSSPPSLCVSVARQWTCWCRSQAADWNTPPLPSSATMSWRGSGTRLVQSYHGYKIARTWIDRELLTFFPDLLYALYCNIEACMETSRCVSQIITYEFLTEENFFSCEVVLKEAWESNRKCCKWSAFHTQLNQPKINSNLLFPSPKYLTIKA